MSNRLSPIFLLGAGLYLTGCMVGPRYVRPSAPVASQYKEQAPTSYKENDDWKAAQPGDQVLRGDWWEIFGDPQLDSLEKELTASNYDLKVDEARLRESRA